MAQILTLEEAYGDAPAEQGFTLGAPGSTTADREAGIFSEADMDVGTPKGGRPATKPKAKTPPTTLSLDEAYGGPKMDTGLKRVGKEAAQVTDMVLGIPAFLAKIGTRGALDMFFAAAGESHPLGKSNQIVEAAMEKPWMQFAAAPIQFITELDPSGTTMGAFTQKFGSVVGQVGESAQEAYGGEWGHIAERGIDLGMAELIRRADNAAKKRAGQPTKEPSPIEPPPVDVPPSPRPEPEVGSLFGKDAQWNAQQRAYDLMQEGASVRKVLATTKRNPLVGKELDKFMQRRTEVREGPMKETLQGEWLSAEEARTQAAARIPDPVEYGKLVQEAAQERLQQAETPKELPPPMPEVFRSGRREPTPEQPGGTPAEQLAVRGGFNAWSKKQQGTVDPEFAEKLGKLALTGAAVPLGALMKTANYTSETLKRLPQNRFEFKKETVDAILNQKDITKAERETFQGVLAEYPGDTITAKQLTDGFKVATQDFVLEKKGTEQYATYGLDQIGGIDYLPAPGIPGGPVTNLWRLPDHMKVSDANHFGDDRLYGWTRDFKENGTPHVVEIQSDLMQHAKPMNAIDSNVLQDQLATIKEAYVNNLKEAPRPLETITAGLNVIAKANNAPIRNDPYWRMGDARHNQLYDMNPEFKKLRDEFDVAVRKHEAIKMQRLKMAEIEAALSAGKGSEKLSPIIKHWPRRLIRETLADAAKTDVPFVRFATADTVAKVEGWPTRYKASQEWNIPEAQAKEYIKDTAPTVRVSSANGNIPEKIVVDATGNSRLVLKNGERHFIGMGDLEEAFPNAVLVKGFIPEHQSIYDRYAKDITPYLRRLGGRDYTDPQGHTWIEVPTPKGPPAMYGRASPEILARIAAAGLGATLGMYFADDKYKGALLGAFGGLVLAKVRPREAVAFMKKATQPDPRIRINDIANVWEATTDGSRIIHDKINRDIKALVPDPNRQAAISHWIEGDKTIKLSANERAAAKIAQDFFAKMKDAAFDAEVLKSARENYVTHMWDWGLQGKGKLEAALARRSGTGMSPRTPYAKERTIATLAEGKKLGLTPRTEVIGEIVEAYGNSMAQAIANKNFLTGLKAAKTPDGFPLILSAKDAPYTYGHINHPQFSGMRVHPDIVPSLEFMFDHPPGLGGRAIEVVNSALKRLAVSFSLFHVKALFDVLLAAMDNPVKAFTTVGGFLRGKDIYLNELKNQGLGPTVKKAVDAGLKFSLRDKPPKVEDIGQGSSFYDGMYVIQKTMDATVPYSGKIAEAFIKVNHAADTVTWAVMHTGSKLQTFMQNYEKVLTNNAKAHAKNPQKVKLLTEKEAAEISAGVANDLYGGLNWRRIAEGVNNRVGRDLALWLLKPSSRRILNVGLFALDWTVSTVKPWFGMLSKGTGVKGLLKPQTKADLYRQYVARSLLYYAVIGDGLNLALSGHHLWENRDPTRVDLGDGRTMQWSKHTMEPIHWLTNPMQQFLNKMGILPKQVAEQATGVEYLTAHGTSPPMEGSRLGHLGKMVSPISAQQTFQAGSAAGVGGMLGMPVYGKTPAQRRTEKLERRLKKRTPEARAEARKKHREALKYRR